MFFNMPISPTKLDRRFAGVEGGKKGKLGAAKGKRARVCALFWARVQLGNQTERTHAHTNERTKRNDFPGGLTPQPPINYMSKNFKKC